MGYDLRQGYPNTEETSRLVRHWRGRRWAIALAVVIVLVLISGTTTWLRDGLQRPLVVNELLRPADVIIVLGAGTKKNAADHLPTQARQRVLEGIRLWQAGWAPRLIVSGGRDKYSNLVEADAMASFAISQGMSDATVAEERQSRDTFENAKFSLALMQSRGWSTAIVVTSPYHTWRSCRIFRHQGANVHCVVAPFSLWPANSFIDRLSDTKSVVREYGAIVYNWVKGQL